MPSVWPIKPGRGLFSAFRAFFAFSAKKPSSSRLAHCCQPDRGPYRAAMVRKSFRLDSTARFYECEGVGFTHIVARCSDCGQACRKPIGDLGWKRRMLTIGDYAKRPLRCACGGRIDPASVWVWAENIRYRGPR